MRISAAEANQKVDNKETDARLIPCCCHQSSILTYLKSRSNESAILFLCLLDFIFTELSTASKCSFLVCFLRFRLVLEEHR
jgi:hypothetical protein